jgi:hypothetical protein
MGLMSVMTPMEFSRAEYSPDHSAPSFDDASEFELSVAVVDMRSRQVVGVRNHCEGSVPPAGISKIPPPAGISKIPPILLNLHILAILCKLGNIWPQNLGSGQI